MAENPETASPARSSRKPQRFGVVDIGSNSVRLVVFDSAMRSPAYFFNEKVYCGLGRDIEKMGTLSPDARAATLQTLRRFALLSKALRISSIKTVATAAMREAQDGQDFADEIERETGLAVRIISGEDEGRYAALGVLLGDRRSEGLVVDIGGASMELAVIRAGKVSACTTTPLGPLRLDKTGKTGEELRDYIAAKIAANIPKGHAEGMPVYLVGGGWRAFATLVMRRSDYPLHVLHAYEFSLDQARETCAWLMEGTETDLTAFGLSSNRAANAALTAHVLNGLIDTLTPEGFVVSSCGLREGVLYESLSPAMRGADPLTQSARVMERLSARFPGFGKELSAWLKPALPDMPSRLRLAASLLADVNWRGHPDYRATACFTTATQSSFVGLTHNERMVLAVALAYRYKNARDAVNAHDGVKILSKHERKQAEAMGRMIRLGAMLSGATPALLRQCPLSRDETHLILTVPKAQSALISETVERRLANAAQQLGLESRIAGDGE